MSCIDVNGLSKSYGSVKAVDDLVFSVKSGQVFGFLGPNGAGKSTTIKLLTTLIPPSQGSLSIFGVDAIENPLQVRHKIGVVLQQPSYEPTLSVEKALDKYGMMWNVPRTERKKRMEQLLKDFDLVEIRKKRNEDLSIGQRRRVQVAREFMHDMDLLFLDEPTVGLDPSARRKLLDYLKNKVKTGLTIFFTTHILTEAEYLCDEIAIINEGKIITVDSPEALKNKFGKEKTIKIHLSEKQSKIPSLLSGIPDYKINFDAGTNIIIHSEQSELILLQVLKILSDNSIEIEDLSAVPTNLEDIFLKMVRENTSNN
jgi:ABC-2 type transport system ATP-binding protein